MSALDRTWYVSAAGEYVARCSMCEALLIAPDMGTLNGMSDSHYRIEHESPGAPTRKL